MSRVLIVDDERSMREMLSIALADEGYEIRTAEDGDRALELLRAEPFEVLVSDIRMPGTDGIELLRQVRSFSPQTDVILITAHASMDSAIEALRLGAYDYVTKPFDVAELKIAVRHALERQALERENVLLRGELTEQHGFDNLVGVSAGMRRVFELIRRVKDSSSTVLIVGESGTGKELVARAIHYNGARAAAPFVAVNCAALPAQLLESELFGHVRGAFTGADRHKQGLFEAAQGGTILLDEIGDMPLELQPKLLRVLEDRKLRRVGATTDSEIDVRVLAATNQDLRAALAQGRFREDLYYRLNVIQIDLPPLRERREDVPLLARHFLEKLSGESDQPPRTLSPEAERLLMAYEWPGNVRELFNAMRHAVTMATGALVDVDSLPASVRAAAAPAAAQVQAGGGAVATAVGGGAGLPDGAGGGAAAGGGEVRPDGAAVTALLGPGFDLERHLEGVRRQFMAAALRRSGGVQKRAAALLGMSFRSFRYYAKKLGLGGEEAE